MPPSKGAIVSAVLRMGSLSCKLWPTDETPESSLDAFEVPVESAAEAAAVILQKYGDRFPGSIRLALDPLSFHERSVKIGILRISHESAPGLGSEFYPSWVGRIVRWNLEGGADIFGSMRLPLRLGDAAALFEDIAASDIDALAIVSSGGLAAPASERAVASQISARNPHLPILISQDVGGIGVRERENLAVQNLSLRPAVQRIVVPFAELLPASSLYFSTGFGELAGADQVLRLPAATENGLLSACVHGIMKSHEQRDDKVFFGSGAQGDWALIASHESDGDLNYELIDSTIGHGLADHDRDLVLGQWRSMILAKHGNPDPVVVSDTGPEFSMSGARDDFVHLGLRTSRVTVRLVRTLNLRDERGFRSEIHALRERLLTEAVRAGADPLRLEEPEISSSPLPYLAEPVRLVRTSLSGVPR